MSHLMSLAQGREMKERNTSLVKLMNTSNLNGQVSITKGSIH